MARQRAGTEPCVAQGNRLGAPAEIRAVDIFPESKADSPTLPPGSAAQRSLTEHLEATERAFLIATLQTHNGVMTEAAATLGISRKTLWEKMRRHGIDKQRVGEEAEGLPLV